MLSFAKDIKIDLPHIIVNRHRVKWRIIVSYVKNIVNDAVFAKIKMSANIVAVADVNLINEAWFVNHRSTIINDINVISILVRTWYDQILKKWRFIVSYVNKNENGAVFAKIRMSANIVALGIVIPGDPSFMVYNAFFTLNQKNYCYFNTSPKMIWPNNKEHAYNYADLL